MRQISYNDFVENNYQRKKRLDFFFNIINKKPQNYVSDKKTKDDYELDVKKFHDFMLKNNKTANTRKAYISTIRTFLYQNGIDISNTNTFDEIKKKWKGKKNATKDMAFTHEDIRKIYSHGNIMERALILTMATSGARIGTILSITLDDLELDKRPSRIKLLPQYLKNNGTGSEEVIFITNEAKDVIKQWLNVRQDELNTLCKYTISRKENKSRSDNRLFPISRNSATKRLAKLLKDAKLDERDRVTDRRKLHLHSFRKFFRTQMPSNDVTLDMVEALMLHEGYLTGSYRRYTDEEKAEAYRKGMYKLLFFEKTIGAEEIKKLEVNGKSRKEVIRTLIDLIEKQSREIKELREEKITVVAGISKDDIPKTSEESKPFMDKGLPQTKRFESKGHIEVTPDMIKKDRPDMHKPKEPKPLDKDFDETRALLKKLKEML